MAERFTHDQPRTESPRLKDVPRVDAAAKRPEGRDGSGRFAPGNTEQKQKGIKSQLRKSLGDAADATNGELVRSALKLYFAMVRELPADGAAVRALCAASARHGALAAHYGNLAAATGLATPDGLKFAEASRQHDTTAQRMSVSAYDRAVREARAKPKDTKAALTARILTLAARTTEGEGNA